MKTVVNVLASWYDFSMRTSLFLIFVSVIVCAAVTVTGAMTYMLFADCTLLTAGVSDTFFNTDFFIIGALKFLPFASVISCLFMIFYLIRHKGHIIVTLAVYAAVGTAVWFAVIPFSHSIIKNIEINTPETVRPELTTGYFRRQGNSIVYYARRSPVYPEYFSGSVINIGTDDEKVSDVEISDKIEGTAPDSLFADQLYEHTLQFPLFFTFILTTVDGLRIMMRTAAGADFTTYLLFSSIGAAFLSLLGLKRVSSWRLFNVAIIIGMFLLISQINHFLYFSSVLDSSIAYLDENFNISLYNRFLITAAFNGLCTLICLIIGMVSYNQNRRLADEADR